MPAAPAVDAASRPVLLHRTAGVATMGAAVLHLDAATAHREHPVVLAFFLAAAAAQLVLAGLLAVRRPAGPPARPRCWPRRSTPGWCSSG